MKRISISWVVLSVSVGVLMGLVVSCGGDGNKKPSQPSETPTYEQEGTIDSGGGTVHITEPGNPLAGAAISIPGDALTSPVTIRIEPSLDPPPFFEDTTVTVVDLQPSGLRFGKLVRITLPWPSDAADSTGLAAYFWDDSLSAWRAVPVVSVDPASRTLVCESDHFTQYTVGRSGVKINGDFIQDRGRIALALLIVTPFDQIPVDGGNLLGFLEGGMLRTTYTRHAQYVVKLYEHSGLSRSLKSTVEIRIHTPSENEYGDRFLVEFEQNGEFMADMQDLSATERLTCYSGLPVVFRFPEPGQPRTDRDYSADVSIRFYNCGYGTWDGHSGTLSPSPYTFTVDRVRWTSMGTAADQDGDGIIDRFDDDNGTAPTATITAPTDGSSFRAGQVITFRGTGNDSEDGPLTESALVWTSDKQLGILGTGTALTSSTLSVNRHRVTLTAMDRSGRTGSASIVLDVTAVSDQAAPTVRITSPVAGSTVSGDVPIVVSASDNVGVVRVVVDGQLGDGGRFDEIGHDATGPYSVRWRTGYWNNGEYPIRATAYDAAGNRGSATIRLVVRNEPILAFETPTGTQSGNIIIRYTVTDSRGGTRDYATWVQHAGVNGMTIVATSSGSIDQYGNLLGVGPGTHTLTWASQTDCPGRWDQAYVGMSLIENGGLTRVVGTTGSFAVDNGGPPTPPACQVTPSSLDFGYVLVGSVTNQSFTIRNSGGGQLTGNVAASCDGFTLASGAGAFSLGAGEQRTVTVRFSPTANGVKQCLVALGPGSCHDLQCIGVAEDVPTAPICEITPSTASLDFGTVSVGSTADLGFRIRNSGGGSLSGTVGAGCEEFAVVSGGGPFSLGASQVQNVTVRFAPVSTGSKTCTIDCGIALCQQVGCSGTGGDQPPPPPPGMVRIPAGTFTMGSPTDEPGRSSDETQHQVTLTKAIYVSTYEVTQAEWQAVMGWNESYFPGTGKPVEEVTWYDAVSYCNQRSTCDGYIPAYTITGATMDGNHITGATVTWNQAANGYRLLTEAEWEYACRATSTTAFCNGPITNSAWDCGDDPGLDLVGWYCGNASNTTHDCGGKTANAWGLKDMHGNVWEWCWDWWGGYPSGSVSDPLGPPSGSDRVVRGGGWSRYALGCRSAYRYYSGPNYRYGVLGLRLARTSP